MTTNPYTKLLSTLEEVSTTPDATLKALLLLLAALQEPGTYSNNKARPTEALKDLIHWSLLAFKPISERLSNGKTIQISETISAYREMGDNGQFSLRLDSLFPPRISDNYIYDFDVCISFSGEQRSIAESIATTIRDEYHLRVFYDDFEKNTLLGNDLYKYLFDIYSRRSKYCIILFSKSYLAKNWTVHELRAAQSRTLKERSSYVLPVLVETDVELPPEFETIAYTNLESTSIDALSTIINNRVWKEKGKYWLMENEMEEVLNDNFYFERSFPLFKERLLLDESQGTKLITFIIGLIWCCNQKNLIKCTNGIFEYLLFAFKPIASVFNENEEFIVLPPNGIVRRTVGGNNGCLLMQKSFWAPIFEDSDNEEL